MRERPTARVTPILPLVAQDTLQVTVTGVGTVEYLGNPQVQKQILGIGKVVPKQ